MEKQEKVHKYELVVIIDAKLGNEAKEAVTKEALDIVNQAGGKVINSRVWLEKQKLTFPIKKCHEGTYYLIQFEGDGKQVQAVRAALRVRERILRCLVVKIK